MESSTIRDSIQAVVDGLTPLADKLQVPIGHLWEWSLKHTYAVIVTDFLEAVLMIGLVIAGISLARYTIKEAIDDPYDVGFHFASAGIVLVLVIMIFGVFYDLEDGINRLVAPEYYTMQDTIKLIK